MWNGAHLTRVNECERQTVGWSRAGKTEMRTEQHRKDPHSGNVLAGQVLARQVLAGQVLAGQAFGGSRVRRMLQEVTRTRNGRRSLTHSSRDVAERELHGEVAVRNVSGEKFDRATSGRNFPSACQRPSDGIFRTVQSNWRLSRFHYTYSAGQPVFW